MKKTLLLCSIMMAGLMSNAQDKIDTIKSGNFIIIKKNNKDKSVSNENQTNDNDINTDRRSNRYISWKNKRKRNNYISTNWWIFDLGFANFRDQTNYTAAQSMGYLKTINTAAGPVTKNSMALNTGKSSNVNIWVFTQKLNLVQHVVNLKYGFGLEMYNYRYDKNISYRSSPSAVVFNDTINFSKNKMYAGYLTVPVMLNVNTTPHRRGGLSFSAGISAGYLLGAHDKQISTQRGKQKYHGDFNLQPWRVALIGELGLGPVRFFGSYSLNAFHNENTGLVQYPYAVGLRFSNW